MNMDPPVLPPDFEKWPPEGQADFLFLRFDRPEMLYLLCRWAGVEYDGQDRLNKRQLARIVVAVNALDPTVLPQ